MHREAVKEWRFEPAMRGARAVQSCTVAQFEVDFPEPPRPATNKPFALVTGRVVHKPDPDRELVHMVTRQYRERGCTFVNMTSFCVDVSGDVIEVATRRSSGIADLDAALRETIEGWRFVPFVVDGAPRRVCSVAEFRLMVA